MHIARLSLAGFVLLATGLAHAADTGTLPVAVHCWDRAPVIIRSAPIQIQALPFTPTTKFGKLLIKNTGSQAITAIVLRTKQTDASGHTLYGTDATDLALYANPLQPGEQTELDIGTAASAGHPLARLEISCEAATLAGGGVIGNDKSPAVSQIRAAHTALRYERKRLLEIYEKGDMQTLAAELKKPVN